MNQILAALAVLAAAATSAPAAEIVRVTNQNWETVVPGGKEVDAVLGDFVLRNDHLVAVVGNTVEGRFTNMVAGDGAGMLIDLTTRAANNDQLVCFYPGGGEFRYRKFEIVKATGPEVILRVVAEADHRSALQVQTDYVLEDGAKGLLVITRVVNTEPASNPPRPTDGELIRLSDRIRAETTFVYSPPTRGDLFWAYDRHWQAAYGVQPLGGLRYHPDAKAAPGSWLPWFGLKETVERPVAKSKDEKADKVEKAPPTSGYTLVQPGRRIEFSRMVWTAAHQLDVSALARTQAIRDKDAEVWPTARISVGDKAGKSIAGVEVDVFDAADAPDEKALAGFDWIKDGALAPPASVPAAEPSGKAAKAAGPRPVGMGHTDAAGKIAVSLPKGRYVVRVRDHGRATLVVPLPLDADGAPSITMEISASVRFVVTDEAGRGSPCKIRFDGVGTTKTPNFAPESAIDSVRNLHYTGTGDFIRTIDAGVYNVIVSRGPEFDAVYRQIKVLPGRRTEVRVQLRRTVNTAGWASADLHSHSTISGDNTGSIHGRILNLICEGVEFAPCTEHNTIHSYRPYLKQMKLEGMLATSDGLELTGRPLPLNHQNTFPIRPRPRTQSGGAPLTDADIERQIRRLAMWDNRSEKLVQINHPDIGWMIYDKDGDGKRDDGHADMLKYGQVIEVWSTEVLSGAAMIERTIQGKKVVVNNRFFNWLQLLNQGHRIFAVANTDAHYNYHGSGWIRNYVKSSADEIGKIDETEMVRSFRDGHVVMSNGPFLEVKVTGPGLGIGKLGGAIPGDAMSLPDGIGGIHIRVQCPNWLDVNRVQVLVNGRADPNLNFTREKNPELFADVAVKFDRTVVFKLRNDAHLIVVAVGEGMLVGPVNGDRNEPPLAVSNPIFIDLDGKGFAGNKDTLGAPLPVKASPN